MSTDSKKKLALAVIDFLNTSITDGTLSSEDKESIEVATQCIADAFKVDPEDKAAMDEALGGQSLQAIYSVFEKMKGKTAAAKPAASPSPAGPKQPTDAEKAEAESLKSKGNAAMSQKDYQTAIDYYSQALKIHPTNPIYLSNRAAAYSSVGNYDAAIKDAEIAVDTDPSYSKAWSRLGHARYSTNDFKGAMDAYKAGIDAEGNGGTQVMQVGYETAKKKYDEQEVARSPPASRTASPMGAGGPGGMMGALSSLLGGMGGAGGKPDFGALMNDPNIMESVSEMMKDPKSLDMVKNMMSNPEIAAMAQNFMGGMGRGAGGAGPASGH
ncbi:glutamine-rich cytoplasmic protein [Sphaerosporella brunnea]|uniref:Glutamine-rich cytoplasmic protein n=1 Tax=Sphaerosporella brunnea TaxID=1250544 RepID=A0A5J5F073_9PEZI|nr:glutamine-rich cytoplasmic protein [Sphaerosporella brunnea]